MVSPVLSIKERDRRRVVARRLMRERRLDALVLPPASGDLDNLQSDLRYMTCVRGSGTATVAFPIQRQPVAAAREGRRGGYCPDALQREVVARRTMGHGSGPGQDVLLTIPNGDGQRLIVEEGDCFVLQRGISDAQDTTSGRIGVCSPLKNRARRIGWSDLEPAVIA
jgi:hypothetical protein